MTYNIHPRSQDQRNLFLNKQTANRIAPCSAEWLVIMSYFSLSSGPYETSSSQRSDCFTFSLTENHQPSIIETTILRFLLALRFR